MSRLNSGNSGNSRNSGKKNSDSGFTARNLALKLLCEISEKQAYANLFVPAALRDSDLEPRDRGFVTELVYGTLRMELLYDEVISRATGRSLSKVDQVPLQILRLTAHQLLLLKTPAHAGVDSAVRLVVKNGHGSASGFVNAVSRRISERTLEEWQELLCKELKPERALSIEFSHPLWIVQAYQERLENLDRVRQELSANNQNPRTTAVIYPGELWSSETLAESEQCPWVEGARFIEGNPERLPEIRAGIAGIQDQGSYLVAQALVRAPIESAKHRPEQWLDLCAGPGGKSALLDRWARASGARFLALERSEHRAELVKRVSTQIVVADSLHPPIRPNSADRILLDAPCSGLGALRRRPDARLRKKPEQIPGLVSLQRELLSSAFQLLAPGGLLAYVTCSPMKEETTGNRDWALENLSGIELIDARPYLPEGIVSEGFDIQLWPGIESTDAMYLALFRKSTR